MQDTISILVVDDEPQNFDVIEGLLLNNNYELSYAPSGSEAISSLGKFFKPDLILLDVMMPDINGIEVCRQIKTMEQWKCVPIIMVTALSSKEDLARCLKAGADDFISKPLNGTELRARVNSMLRIKKQYDKIESWSKLQKNTIKILEQSLDQLRGNVASNLSNELSLPLNGILSSFMMMEVVLEDNQRNIDLQLMRETIEKGRESTNQLEKIIQQLLMYFYLEQEDTQHNPKTFEPNNHQHHIEKIAKSKAKSFNRLNDLILDIDSAHMKINSSDLEFLLNQLIDNAFKFSQPQTLVRVLGQAVNGYYQLQIIDSGIGMTQEQIGKIGAFIQFETSLGRTQGLGLGLEIAKKLVSFYRGTLLIESIYEKGTTIEVLLPLMNIEQLEKQEYDEIIV